MQQEPSGIIQTAETRPRVSVVVRAFNEGAHLGRLLEGLASQTRVPDEIVLVDSGSTDDTVAIAERHGCKVVHIAKHEFSFGRALNLGCAAASGEILLIVSAHVYPIYDTYVEHLIGAFARDGVAIAYGRQVGDHRTKFSESRIMRQWFPEESIWDQGHPFSNNANAAVLRRVWEPRRYNEELTGLEDLEFAQRVIGDGMKIAYVADASVVHVHEETWSIIQNRYRREAIAYARIMENARMSLPRALALAAKNILEDFADAARSGRFFTNCFSIPRFRFAQFLGAWQGFRQSAHLSEALLQRFYYPPDRVARHSAQTPGNPIRYTVSFEELNK